MPLSLQESASHGEGREGVIVGHEHDGLGHLGDGPAVLHAPVGGGRQILRATLRTWCHIQHIELVWSHRDDVRVDHPRPVRHQPVEDVQLGELLGRGVEAARPSQLMISTLALQ